MYEGTGNLKGVRWFLNIQSLRLFGRSVSAPVSDPEESPTRREGAPAGLGSTPEGVLPRRESPLGRKLPRRVVRSFPRSPQPSALCMQRA